MCWSGTGNKGGRNGAAGRSQPRPASCVFSTCQQSRRPCTAASSLAFEVSIPAVSVLPCVIFVDPTLSKRTSCSSNHAGPMKGAGAILLQSSHTGLRAHRSDTSCALPWTAIRGRAFLAEFADNIRSRYYKGVIAQYCAGGGACDAIRGAIAVRGLNASDDPSKRDQTSDHKITTKVWPVPRRSNTIDPADLRSKCCASFGRADSKHRPLPRCHLTEHRYCSTPILAVRHCVC